MRFRARSVRLAIGVSAWALAAGPALAADAPPADGLLFRVSADKDFVADAAGGTRFIVSLKGAA